MLLAAMLAKSNFAAAQSAPTPITHQSIAQSRGFNSEPSHGGAAHRVKGSHHSWSALEVSQQAALMPLAGHWDELSDAQKTKWMALSRNFDSLTPVDQQRLHSRMTDWAMLTTQQRAQARISFAQAARLDPDEKKAKWEAYQALSDAEKKRLATDGHDRPHGAAAVVRPPIVQRPAEPAQAPTLEPLSSLPRGSHGLTESAVNRETLLPKKAKTRAATPPIVPAIPPPISPGPAATPESPN